MGELDLPYESVPGGPIPLDLSAHVCGGVAVRSIICRPDDNTTLPGLVFDFYLANGERLAPVALLCPVESMLGFPDLVRKAVRDAVREARV